MNTYKQLRTVINHPNFHMVNPELAARLIKKLKMLDAEAESNRIYLIDLVLCWAMPVLVFAALALGNFSS